MVEGPFETALGSLREARAGVRIAVAWGYVADSTVAPLVESLDSLGGRLFGLGRRPESISRRTGNCGKRQ